MAENATYPLTHEPQVIAHNKTMRTKSYVLTNQSAAVTAELLGEGEALGEGTPITGAQVSFDLGPEEKLYAAAPDADSVTIRVLEYLSQ